MQIAIHLHLERWRALSERYTRVFKAAWGERHALRAPQRTPLEAQFLPAALEIMETPAPAAARAVLWTLVLAAVCALLWSVFGFVDTVAVAQGRVTSAGHVKTIAAAETAVVRAIHVRDGQQVKAGQVLAVLEVAGTATAAESERVRSALAAALLEATRNEVLANAADGQVTQVFLPAEVLMPREMLTPPEALKPNGSVKQAVTPAALLIPDTGVASGGVATTEVATDVATSAASADHTAGNLMSALSAQERATELRTLQSQYQEHRARLLQLDAAAAEKDAQLVGARERVSKLEHTLPIAREREQTYRNLLAQNFVSRHGYLEKQEALMQQEGDLASNRAQVKELAASLQQVRAQRTALIAEFRRTAEAARGDAAQKAAQLAQELIKATTRERSQHLIAPVDGIVQQLAIHTVGGVATAAQPLMLIAPVGDGAEVEALLPNKDVGFVRPGQTVVVKIDSFPFTRYGTVAGTVDFVSGDAIADEKLGFAYQVRVKLAQADMQIDDKRVHLTPGMTVAAEIHTGYRRVIDYVLDPIKKTTTESLRER